MANSQTHQYESPLIPLIDAQAPVIVINANKEEARLVYSEMEALRAHHRVQHFYQWDSTRVLTETSSGRSAEITDPLEVVTWFAQSKPNDQTGHPEGHLLRTGCFRNNESSSDRSLLFMLDAMSFMPNPGSDKGHSNPRLTRAIKNLSKTLQAEKKVLVLVTNDDYIPPELQSVVSFTKLPLPDLDHMRVLIRRACSWFAKNKEKLDEWLKISEEQEIDIATLLLGFRASEAEQILTRSVIQNSKMRLADKTVQRGFDVESIRSEKIKMAASTRGVELVIPDRTMKLQGREAIGGSGALVEWFGYQNQLFGEKARLDGIKPPRGGIVYGPAGTGKDWTIERLAEAHGWNVLRADIGAMESKWLGESHEAFLACWEAARRCTPCFLVFSEFEKMFAEAFEGQGASGTQSKMFATFLNLMQRHKEQIFVWALTNEIHRIPSAALRSGRFNRIWFMDLPNDFERSQTIEIHLKLSGWDVSELNLDMPALVEKTREFSNAEIADGVNEAIGFKFISQGGREEFALTQEHLVEGFNRITPMSRVKPEELKQVRSHAQEANSPRCNNNSSGIIKSVNPRRIGSELASTI